jgi:hypothetical protein
MFEELDHIDWRQFIHSYGVATNVPAMLRAMAAVDVEITEATDHNSEVWGVYDDFANTLNHQGDIYNAVAPCVPFLVEMISNATIKNRHILLQQLENFLDVCNMHVGLRGDLAYLRDAIDAYRAIRDHYSDYVKLLDDPDSRIRFHATLLLSSIIDVPGLVRRKLWHSAQYEADPYLQAHKLHAVSCHVPPHWRAGHRALARKYLDVFESIAQENSQKVIRWAASTSWVRVAGELFYEFTVPHTIPGHIIDELIDLELTHSNWFSGDAELKRQVQFNSIPFDSRSALKCAGIIGLTLALQANRLTHQLAHELGRELLNLTFPRVTQGFLSDGIPFNWDSYRDGRDTYFYRHRSDKFPSISGSSLIPRQKAALEAIVACDPFWEQPTNLFSFFYELPDDREALRRMVPVGRQAGNDAASLVWQ